MRLAKTLEGDDGLEFANANLMGQVTLSWDDERVTATRSSPRWRAAASASSRLVLAAHGSSGPSPRRARRDVVERVAARCVLRRSARSLEIALVRASVADPDVGRASLTSQSPSILGEPWTISFATVARNSPSMLVQELGRDRMRRLEDVTRSRPGRSRRPSPTDACRSCGRRSPTTSLAFCERLDIHICDNGQVGNQMRSGAF